VEEFGSRPKCVNELPVEKNISKFQCMKKVEVVITLGKPCR
jgi:hypothetical protein